jgi:hypothetical protein
MQKPGIVVTSTRKNWDYGPAQSLGSAGELAISLNMIPGGKREGI